MSLIEKLFLNIKYMLFQKILKKKQYMRFMNFYRFYEKYKF